MWESRLRCQQLTADAAGRCEPPPCNGQPSEQVCAWTCRCACAHTPLHRFPTLPLHNPADLPGVAALNPKRKRVADLELSLVPAIVEGPTGSNGQMLRFVNSFYRDDKTGETFV